MHSDVGCGKRHKDEIRKTQGHALYFRPASHLLSIEGSTSIKQNCNSCDRAWERICIQLSRTIRGHNSSARTTAWNRPCNPTDNKGAQVRQCNWSVNLAWRYASDNKRISSRPHRYIHSLEISHGYTHCRAARSSRVWQDHKRQERICARYCGRTRCNCQAKKNQRDQHRRVHHQ